tara:strand:- start:7470 stop:7958 length:489 start_codon:yes stop_codon:yes gene_type:complete
VTDLERLSFFHIKLKIRIFEQLFEIYLGKDMRFTKRITQPEVFLRLGLGLTFLWSGYNIYTTPENWLGFLEQLPAWLIDPLTTYLTFEQILLAQGVAEMVFGAVFLLWFVPYGIVKLVSFIVALELAVIIWLLGVDTVTFRDIGLLGATLAVFAGMHWKNRR